MGDDQIAQMARSIAKVYEGVTTPDDAPGCFVLSNRQLQQVRWFGFRCCPAT